MENILNIKYIQLYKVENNILQFSKKNMSSIIEMSKPQLWATIKSLNLNQGIRYQDATKNQMLNIIKRAEASKKVAKIAIVKKVKEIEEIKGNDMTRSELWDIVKKSNLQQGLSYQDATKKQLLSIIQIGNVSNKATNVMEVKKVKKPTAEISKLQLWAKVKDLNLYRGIDYRYATKKQLIDIIRKNDISGEATEFKAFLSNPIAKAKFSLKRMSAKQALENLIIPDGYRIVMIAGRTGITINNLEKVNLIQETIQKSIIELEETHGSDAEIALSLLKAPKEVVFKLIPIGKARPSGGYFKYYHNLTNVDLSKYGIFTCLENADYAINCLERALINAGVDINPIKSMIKTRQIPMKDIKFIAEKLSICIQIYNIKTGKVLIYGNKSKDPIKINLLDEHYFTQDKTTTTTFALKNFEKIQYMPSWNLIRAKDGKKYKYINSEKDKQRFILSSTLVQHLIKNKETFLREITAQNGGFATTFENRLCEYDELSISFEDCKPFKQLEKIENQDSEECPDIIDSLEGLSLADIEKLKQKRNLEQDNNQDYNEIPDEGDFVNCDEPEIMDNIDFSHLLSPEHENEIYAFFIFPNEIGYFFDEEEPKEEEPKEEEPKEEEPEQRRATPAMGSEQRPTFPITEPCKPVIFFDFETTTNGDKHEPYMLCDSRNKTFHGINSPLKWLQSIEEDSYCIAHNLRYDFSMLIKYLSDIKDLIQTGTKIKQVKGKFYNQNTGKTIKLIFKDSYAFLTMPLSGFTKCFNLDVKKEIMPYEAYNTKTANLKTIGLAYALQFIKDEDKEEFLQNPFIDGENFKHIEYAEYYCKLDVDILKQGYLTFRGWIMEITGIDILTLVSAPQLANKFGLNEGVFDGCYQLAGVPRDFIQRCVVGGRCMTRRNEIISVKGEVDDFDGVSLYPSAMHRLPGLLKGRPKIWNKKTDLTKASGYFLEIEIIDVGKKRAFPLISRKNENGVRDWNDNIRGRIYIDNIALEDLIRFQKITYKIIRGYYYDDGFNPKLSSFMEMLFNERAIKKAAKNPIQTVYKDIMNAFYGRLIMKPVNEEQRIIYGDNTEFLQLNFNRIKEYVQITDTMTLFKLAKPINDHFSAPHLGVHILSMSKRIMNEVMCLAEDNDMNIFYQDTDSMHILKECVEPLGELFKKKYKRDLIGKQLGQFHSDFDFKSEKDYPPFAVESIFLGKKSYIDKVQVKHGEKISHKFHMRMKGIPSGCLLKKTEEFGGPMKLYKNLLKHKEIEFNLLDCCKFKMESNYTITNNEVFTRKLKF
jgi:hypothetical protein